jgi:BON domain
MRRYVFRLAILSLALLGTSSVRADDQQIAQQIIERLQAEKKAGALKGFSIDLQVDEGTVWLTGRVASEQQQAKALDLARRVAGVKQVVNDLTITEPPSRPSAVAKATPPAPATPNYAQEPTPAGSQQELSSLVAAGPSPIQAVPVPQENKPFSPAQSSVLNSVSKTLMGAVHGNQQPTPVQRASSSQDVASPIGSGVDPNTASSRRSVVQAAQPIANVPQQFATADGMQPIYPAAPQMTAYMPMQMPYMVPVYAGSQMQVPLAVGSARAVQYVGGPVAPGGVGAPVPMYMPGSGVGIAPARYDHPTMPGYAWPSYAAYPNYAAVTYPKQYSPTAWPYIGPFYPYPQVPLGWRKVTMEWDDGWWFLDFKDRRTMYNH